MAETTDSMRSADQRGAGVPFRGGALTGAREAGGLVVGALLAPFVALTSWCRNGRMFHPDGVTFSGEVEPHPGCDPEFRPFAERLSGLALARLSGALWRRGFEHFDVLGFAVRFRQGPASAVAADGDQDLLFATILSPLTMGSALFTTTADDFLANDYWAVSPFDVGIGHHVKLRLVSPHSAQSGTGDREARLRRAVEDGRANFRLDARRTFGRVWSPVAAVTLDAEVRVDQDELHFSPFRSGRGAVPRGFVHALRLPAYTASQAGRSRSARVP